MNVLNCIAVYTDWIWIVIICFCWEDYSDERAVECINSDVVNTFCNLLSRCSAKAINSDQIFPKFDATVFEQLALPEEQNIMSDLYHLPGNIYINNYIYILCACVCLFMWGWVCLHVWVSVYVLLIHTLVKTSLGLRHHRRRVSMATFLPDRSSMLRGSR